jgi:serine/threonine-protein kinase
MPPPAGPPDRRRLIGTVVGGVYKVKAMLGQGGMASVYEAEQMPMGRDVALKVLALDRSIGDEPWKRFLLEARAAASLSHPNICQVFDFGELEDKSPFYTMERLVGEPLSERIARDNALGFVDVVDILMQILAGLAAAHKKNIVHRDIKPENVFLIVRDGRPPLVKLLDFGVSKIVAPDEGEDITQITRTGIVMGTPYYMAPEQAYGGRDFDARVDLWSAGVIFYEAIVGRRPFTANNYAALLNAIIREPHKPVRDLRPGTPIEVQMVIDKALSKAREDRYQSATAFMGDLQRLRERLARMGLVPGSSSKLPVVPPAPPGEDEGHR